jgi:hypothetical protein
MLGVLECAVVRPPLLGIGAEERATLRQALVKAGLL